MIFHNQSHRQYPSYYPYQPYPQDSLLQIDESLSFGEFIRSVVVFFVVLAVLGVL